MKYLLLTSFLAFSLVSAPVMAQQTTMTKAEIKAQLKEEKARQRADRKKNKTKSSEAIVATPTPAPAPTVVTPSPAPTTTITPYMQAQIDAALARPQSFNCTYCAAFAASQGDLATVAAIGAGTYMEGAATAQIETTVSEAPPAPEAAPAQADTGSSTPTEEQSETAPTQADSAPTDSTTAPVTE